MTTTDPFSSPAEASSGIKYADHIGALLLVDVRAIEHGIKTTFGEKEAVRGDVHVIDGPGAGEQYIDALIFPSVLIGQLKPRVGGKVLGRLAQGNAKPGQQPPWVLSDPSDKDKALGRDWLNRNNDIPF